MWAVSLSADESSDTESNVSSYSADVERLAWDSSEDFYYKLYYEEEEDEDYEEERSLEINDHGPIEISEDSSADKEAVPDEDEDDVATEDFRKVVQVCLIGKVDIFFISKTIRVLKIKNRKQTLNSLNDLLTLRFI